MRLNKIDKKLDSLGYRVIKANRYGFRYEKFDPSMKVSYVVETVYRHEKSHQLVSYCVNDMKAVGLTPYEIELFLKQMKKLGIYSKSWR